ncbi:MAG: hypothetical protein QGM47_10850, partial [Actinomycetota bacterium]|nr:hypothetical protein [Actinomycetota bacterium]
PVLAGVNKSGVHQRPSRIPSPAISVELPPNRGDAGVFRRRWTGSIVVPVFFYRSFYRVPRVGAWKEKQS